MSQSTTTTSTLENREAIRAALGLHRKSSAIQKHFYEPAYKPIKKTTTGNKKKPVVLSSDMFEIKSFLQVYLHDNPLKCKVQVQWDPLPGANGVCEVSHESIWEVAKDLQCQGEFFESLKAMVLQLPMPYNLMNNLRGSRYYHVAKKIFNDTPEDRELYMAAKQLVELWSFYEGNWLLLYIYILDFEHLLK